MGAELTVAVAIVILFGGLFFRFLRYGLLATSPFPEVVRVDFDTQIFPIKLGIPGASDRVLVTIGGPVRVVIRNARSGEVITMTGLREASGWLDSLGYSPFCMQNVWCRNHGPGLRLKIPAPRDIESIRDDFNRAWLKLMRRVHQQPAPDNVIPLQRREANDDSQPT